MENHTIEKPTRNISTSVLSPTKLGDPSSKCQKNKKEQTWNFCLIFVSSNHWTPTTPNVAALLPLPPYCSALHERRRRLGTPKGGRFFPRGWRATTGTPPKMFGSTSPCWRFAITVNLNNQYFHDLPWSMYKSCQKNVQRDYSQQMQHPWFSRNFPPFHFVKL